MTHVRAHLRDRLKTMLEADQGLAGVAVYKNRTRPIGLKGEASAVEILITREASDQQGNHTGKLEYSRTIDVQLVGYVSGSDVDEVADEVDALALALEIALHKDQTINGLAIDAYLESTDMVLDSNAYANASFAQTWKILVHKSHEEIAAL